MVDYLTFGVHNGFYIVDTDTEITGYECKNYKSATTGPAFEFLDSLILSEISNGKLVVTKDKPLCVHSLGAVPKKESNKWRPITDCRQPLGESINNFMSSTYREFCYTTVDQVVDMILPGMFLASIDIASAYRSILIHPTQWKYQGLSWNVEGQQVYLLRCAPYLFTQVSNFILRCFMRRGFSKCVVYLDDFLVAGESFEECELAQVTLIELLRSLGFYIAWAKCTPISQRVVYLGVEFDMVHMSVSIPPDKLRKLHSELDYFNGKTRATKKQIQKLCGILSHCSKVVKGGRTFSRRIIDLLKGLPQHNARIRLSREFQEDIHWWRGFADTFNGCNLMVKFNYGQGPYFYTDVG